MLGQTRQVGQTGRSRVPKRPICRPTWPSEHGRIPSSSVAAVRSIRGAAVRLIGDGGSRKRDRETNIGAAEQFTDPRAFRLLWTRRPGTALALTMAAYVPHVLTGLTRWIE